MNIEEFYQGIREFIFRWQTPPSIDSPQSLRMMSDFALTAGGMLDIRLVGNEVAHSNDEAGI